MRLFLFHFPGISASFPLLLKEYAKLYHHFSKPEFEYRMDHIRQIGIKKKVQEKDLDMAAGGFLYRERRKHKVIRLFENAYEQPRLRLTQ
jgi:hypothetical protein